MIEYLSISDLGVIGGATVELDRGLTVVTGETGAGKTMVVTALGLLLGQRADSGAVRRGASRAIVDAGVRVGRRGRACAIAQEAGAVIDEADGPQSAEAAEAELVLTRTVTATPEGGTRSRATAGGRAIPVGVLSEIGACLVAVHGQTDQLRLRSAEAQRRALDAFGGAELADRLATYRDVHRRFSAARAEHQELTEHLQERAREADALQRSLEEIDEAEPVEGEDEALRERIRRLEDVEQLRAAAGGAHGRLAGADAEAADDALGAVALVEAARQDLLAAPGQDSEFEAAAGRLAEAAVVLGDIAGDLARLVGDLEADAEGDLDAAQSRLAELTRLQRLYGPELSDVLAWAERQRPRLEELQGDTGRVDELTAELADLRRELAEHAAALSELRSEAARRLEDAVTEELHALFMPDASFHVQVRSADADRGSGESDADERFGQHGVDEVALLLRPHAGVEPRELGRGASGGELSRVMLALEVVLAATDPVPTFVFDEVDAGVGGEAAVRIGARLARLAEHVRVVCVTHLPQVAAFADRHVRVEKNSDPDAGVTTSDVRALDDDERVEELARMLAGHADSAAAREHAAELIETSRRPTTAGEAR